MYIKWDTMTDTGKALPWPYKAPFPASGQFEAADDALWCRVWDFGGGKYVPLGLARLDAGKDEFTGYYPFPKDDAFCLCARIQQNMPDQIEVGDEKFSVLGTKAMHVA